MASTRRVCGSRLLLSHPVSAGRHGGASGQGVVDDQQLGDGQRFRTRALVARRDLSEALGVQVPGELQLLPDVLFDLPRPTGIQVPGHANRILNTRIRRKSMSFSRRSEPGRGPRHRGRSGAHGEVQLSVTSTSPSSLTNTVARVSPTKRPFSRAPGMRFISVSRASGSGMAPKVQSIV